MFIILKDRLKPKNNSLPICLILLSVFLHTITMYGQTASEDRFYAGSFSFSIENMPLQSFLSYLQNDLKIPLVYTIDDLPLELDITMKIDEGNPTEIIQKLCQYSELSCEYIQGFYIVKRNPFFIDADPLYKMTHVNMDNTNKDLEDNRIIYQVPYHLELSGPPSFHISSQESISFSSLPAQDSPISPVQKKKEDLRLSASIIISKLYFLHSFHPGMIDIQHFSGENSFQLGVCIHITQLLNHLWFTTGCLHSNVQFHYHYNYQVLDLHDPTPIPDHTDINLRFIQAPLEIAYELPKLFNTQGLLSAGMENAFPVKKSESTSYLNDQSNSTIHYLDESNSFIQGAYVGIKLIFPAIKHIQVMLESDYTQYFKTFNTMTMKAPSKRISVGGGFLFY